MNRDVSLSLPFVDASPPGSLEQRSGQCCSCSCGGGDILDVRCRIRKEHVGRTRVQKELVVIQREIVDADDFKKVASDPVPNRARLVRGRECVAQTIFEQETG